MDKVFIHVKFRQVVKKTGKTQTYNSEELLQLNQYLDVKYTETGDTFGIYTETADLIAKAL